MRPFQALGRSFRNPGRAAVVICADGVAPEYVDAAVAAGVAPSFGNCGFRADARCHMPAFTNVNNVSIITGVSPAVHGISGNYALLPRDRDLKGPNDASGHGRSLIDLEPVVMGDPALLRVEETILSAAAAAGWRVAVITAKNKLTKMLGAFMQHSHSRASVGAQEHGALCISMEHPLEASAELERWTRRVSGGEESCSLESLLARRPGSEDSVIDVPESVYSAEVSLACARVAAGLVEKNLADLIYVSTTDFIQHKHAPRDSVALKFTSSLDEHFGRMKAAGAVVGLTADHGMQPKQRSDGSPNAIFLEDTLQKQFPELTSDTLRVILPITDPYVVHHGALGSFASLYIEPALASSEFLSAIRSFLLCKVEGVSEVHDRSTAAALLGLPADRIGDLVILSDRTTVLGTSQAQHDLSAVSEGLRSHGGRYEEMVPILLSDPVLSEPSLRRCDLRNSDIFELVLNGSLELRAQ